MRAIAFGSRALAFAAVGAFLAACSGNTGPTTSSALPITSSQAAHPPQVSALSQAHRSAASGKIKHVVIIVQENRSFNDLFNGFPGATTASYGYDTYGDKSSSSRSLSRRLGTSSTIRTASWPPATARVATRAPTVR